MEEKQVAEKREERHVAALEKQAEAMTRLAEEKAKQNLALDELNRLTAIGHELQRQSLTIQQEGAERIGRQLANVQSGVTQILTVMGLQDLIAKSEESPTE